MTTMVVTLFLTTLRVNISGMSKSDPIKTPSRTKRRPYRGVSAGDRVRERREQLVAAGLECFGTQGYHGVTVKQLCAQAQLTERYFYESFKGREALFSAVYESLIETMRKKFMAIAAPHAPNMIAMARAGLRNFFVSLKHDPRLARIILVDVLTVSPEMERRAQAATFGFADLIKQTTVASGGAPARSDIDIGLIASGLIGASVSIAMRWSADEYHPPVENVINTAMVLFDATIERLGNTPASQFNNPSA